MLMMLFFRYGLLNDMLWEVFESMEVKEDLESWNERYLGIWDILQLRL